jgi:FHS family L-fucose permease-like MFS transporter
MEKPGNSLVKKEYILPFILVTSLFFMWGFARSILDVLNKHFQQTMDISVFESTKIQVTTYLGYFLMALPAGIFITRWGYRRGVVLGLLLFGIGSLLFIPGESMMSFNAFLLALFIVGCGLVVLETAANPYITELGDRSTGASRLNLAQSFNGLGCIVAPAIVGQVLFNSEGGSIALPYTIMGVIVLAIAFVFTRVKLPEIVDDSAKEEEHQSTGKVLGKLFRNSTFMLGIGALFFYEIAEISINSLFINYVTNDAWMTPAQAATLLSLCGLGLFMCARVVGSWIMSKVAAEKVLVVCAVGTVLGSLLVTLDLGWTSRIALFACYAFEAIMFPTIFALSVRGLGSSTKIASSLLMMTPIGGAVGTLLMGYVASVFTISFSFIVPCIGYAFVLFYSLYAVRRVQK